MVKLVGGGYNRVLDQVTEPDALYLSFLREIITDTVRKSLVGNDFARGVAIASMDQYNYFIASQAMKNARFQLEPD